MTPQRELVFRSFFELGEHVSVDELFERVRQTDSSIGYSTVWRNLKLICQVGLAREVNVGDGVTRYDRVTRSPHGHFFCHQCKALTEFPVDQVVGQLAQLAQAEDFQPEEFVVEIHGICSDCRAKNDNATGNGGGKASKNATS